MLEIVELDLDRRRGALRLNHLPHFRSFAPT
jgi:hypothetical protein